LIADLALPNYENLPALPTQPPGVLLISLAVPFELGKPIVETGFREVRAPA